ncbi:MAG: MBL fold metallo-hydrolase [Candidatus Omnitrophota bacterium]|nr:MBL fold metallo-hydrolase [Candidatus Omnitrophota bacterium]MBU1928789.1 MBL fold metallo-hydrolase [Candidatus Omnitrophota bacterium]MBU2034248.1 MBL fold metallo-hydrolase [Candidatus Omnitrophota bacterium]
MNINAGIAARYMKVRDMRIKNIFDKDTLNKKLRTGWGVSFLVDNRVLFDTGENGEWLLENMRSLGVDINKIEAVVISHDHWDHWGGLWDLLQQRKGMPVYMCPHFGPEFKDKALALGADLVEIEKLTQIIQNVFSTGEIPGAYKGKYMAEQALVLKTKNGLTIITGCAHPGILKMVEKARTKFPDESIYLVLGGFHLMESDKRAIEIVAENFKKMNIIKTGPTHCSGDVAKEIFKRSYGDNFIPIKAGQDIEV